MGADRPWRDAIGLEWGVGGVDDTDEGNHAMSERAGDSAAAVRAGETSNRHAEGAGPARRNADTPLDGQFDAPEKIGDIDAALADVAEDLARLDAAAGETTDDPPPPPPAHRGGGIDSALGDVASALDGAGVIEKAATLAALDEELAGGVEAPADAPAEAAIDDALGKIFETQASAVRRPPKPKAAPAPEPAGEPEAEPAADMSAVETPAGEPESERAEAEAPADEIEIEIEEVAASGADFEPPDDLLGAPTAGDLGAIAEAAAAAQPAPARRERSAEPRVVEGEEEDQDAAAAHAGVEIEIEEVEARAGAPAPGAAQKPDALAAAAEAAAKAREAAKAPASNGSKLGALLSPVVGVLVIVNKPFGRVSRTTRDTLGLLGAGTLFNAACAWVYWLLIR